MIDIITGLVGAFLPNFWPYILAAVGVITSLFVARRSGVKAERAKQDKATVKAVQKGAQGAADAASELRAGKTPEEIRNANDASWR